jgi:hypothetical protein
MFITRGKEAEDEMEVVKMDCFQKFGVGDAWAASALPFRHWKLPRRRIVSQK